MLGLIMILAAAGFGAGVVRRLGGRRGRIERLALASACALTAGPWILFLAAWGLGFAIGLPVGVAALAGAGWWLGRGHRVVDDADDPGPSWLSWTALGVLFALLFHSHMLHAEASGLWTGGSSYGDLALHATLAMRFSQDELGFASPLMAGEPLTYPFLGDFTVACLMRGGWSMSTAFAVTGWLSAMTGLALVDALVRRMFGRRAAGTIAVWLIVLSGALIGLWYAATDMAAKGLPSELANLPNYTHMRDRGVTWANLTCDFFLPQRALLAALPAVWAATLLLRQAVDAGAATSAETSEVVDGIGQRRQLIAVALLAGALPLFHVHSFLVVMGMVGLVVLWRTAVVRGSRAPWWLLLAAIAVLVAPQLLWQLGSSWHGGFGKWQLGWLAPRGQFWRFWLANWGLPLALVPVAIAIAVRAARRGRGVFPLVLVVGGVATFAAANLYQFQPHDWDNMKLFVYAHMGIAAVLAGGLSHWLAAGGARRALAKLAIVAMTGSGALAVARELDLRVQLASTEDLTLAAALRAAVPPDARVLTSDQHNHVVPMLAGRKIVMGYRGWLWTHGIDYQPLERDVEAMFAGGAGVGRLFRRHGVTHVYIGPGEAANLHADLAWFQTRYPRVLAAHGAEVFDVRAPLAARIAATAVAP